MKLAEIAGADRHAAQRRAHARSHFSTTLSRNPRPGVCVERQEMRRLQVRRKRRLIVVNLVEEHLEWILRVPAHIELPAGRLAVERVFRLLLHPLEERISVRGVDMKSHGNRQHPRSSHDPKTRRSSSICSASRSRCGRSPSTKNNFAVSSSSSAAATAASRLGPGHDRTVIRQEERAVRDRQRRNRRRRRLIAGPRIRHARHPPHSHHDVRRHRGQHVVSRAVRQT